MFAEACDLSELTEGKYDVAAVNRTLVLLVWPTGGEIKAFHGMCPHANEPLADARFDGSVLACRHHDWEFDATSGNCVRGQPCQLKHFPVEVRDGKVWVDTPAPAPKPA